MDSGNNIPNTNSNTAHIIEQEFSTRHKRRVITILFFSFLLLILISGTVAGTLVLTRRRKSTSPLAAQPPQPSTDNSILHICSVTQYPRSCNSSISAFFHSSNISNSGNSENLTTQEIFKLSIQVSLNELTSQNFTLTHQTNPVLQKALTNCRALIQDSVEHLQNLVQSPFAESNDIRTWLSAAITSIETCLDGLTESTPESSLLDFYRNSIQNSGEFTSNSLAIFSNFQTLTPNLHSTDSITQLTGNPGWISTIYDRNVSGEENLEPDLVVAKDGSGDYETISEAVKAIPKMRKERFLIYVKRGEYVENVEVESDQWNVWMIGDGMDATIVSGDRSFGSGTPTYSTATFAVNGPGFVAKYMGFMNTAGPKKQQAVAVRSSSDKSVFFRCSFDAYQDTLYALSNRQFYRECVIIGTIDFIFGNAAVIFQNCSIRVGQPLPGQFNTVTAQGKSDPNQNTGISIHKCEIIANSGDITAATYLGRPWKNYSTTVVMTTEIGSLVDPAGWAQWLPGIDPPKTIFYAEDGNSGLGSNVSQRVTWQGYRRNMTREERGEFSVESFIQGDKWLPETGVKYE